MKMIKLPSIRTVFRAASIGKSELISSAVFTVILVLGYLLSTYESLDAKPLGTGHILIYLCGAFVIWAVLLLCFGVFKQFQLRQREKPKTIVLETLSDKKLWLLTSLAIFICYLPVMALSLSVLTPDSWSSVAQATGETTLTNAHPIIFTGFVSIFIHIGKLFGSIELGAVLFSLVQSAILAMIFAQVIVWMRREQVGTGFIIATFLFYAILPINAIAGTIMWKDILFAGFGLIFLLLLRQLYIEKDTFFTKKRIAYFILFAFLFCAWRNNGVYAYAVSSILIMALSYKVFFKTKYVLVLAAPVLLYIIYSAFSSLISQPTSQAEAMSVPLQQIARTVKYDSGTLSADEKLTIGEILPYDKLAQEYNPNLSDPVKSSFNIKAFNENKGKYIALWLKLLVEHKKTFVAAFLYNTYGYVYPLSSSSTTTDITMDNASHFNAPKGYSDIAYTDGRKLALGKYRDLLMSAMPLFRNIGFYTCVILFGVYVAVIRKRYELTGVFIVLLCLFITTILGPVNGEFRYLYLFVIAAPFVVGSTYYCHKPERNKEIHA